MEIEKVYISNNVKKILATTTVATGYLAGWEKSDEKFVLAVSGSADYFIAGLKTNGFFCFLDNPSESESGYLKLCEHFHDCLQIDLEDFIALFLVKSGNDEDNLKIIAKTYSTYYNTLTDLIVEDIVYIPAVLLRARGQIPCLFEVSGEPDTLKENIDQALEKLRATFQREVAAFLLHNVVIQHNSADPTITSILTIKHLLKTLPEDEMGKARAKRIMKKKIPTEFEIFLQATGDVALESSFNHSMVIHCQRREFQCASVQIPLDVLLVCQDCTSVETVYKLFLNAIDQQLVQVNQCLVKYTKNTEIDIPMPYHFYPDMWDFPMTLVYPLQKTDKELKSYREELHKKLLLPMDRPFLKKLNNHAFSAKSSYGYLFNPHEGLTSMGVTGGRIALVQGSYTYHHYMQDHINDNGWGCAYRSLQTIISWFKYQGYTDRGIPTHESIQRALVEVGDKPQSFIGSKKWIGSQEVSFCLEHLLKVQSRILFVSSGSEMANKGRELFNHFTDQGTPIMIGGGVLAHTIIGVDFNQETGDLRFLILDPHYTGREDLSIILSKGWCGWKDVKFWDPAAFYNLCLPQRPIEI